MPIETHPLILIDNQTCSILNGPCDNPKGCEGCYHKWAQRAVNVRNRISDSTVIEKREMGVL